MAQLHPYIHFNGNCREAMTFYHGILGGELTMQTVGESPMAGGMPPEMSDKILHASLKSPHFILMSSDMMDEGQNPRNDVISLCLHSADKEEIRSLYNKLVDGGTVSHELTDEFFGMYGDLKDKFSISWMFQSDANNMDV